METLVSPLVATIAATVALLTAIVALALAVQARRESDRAQAALDNSNHLSRELRSLATKFNALEDRLAAIQRQAREAQRQPSTSQGPRPVSAARPAPDPQQRSAAPPPPRRFYLKGRQRRHWDAADVLPESAVAEAQFRVTLTRPDAGHIDLALSQGHLNAIEARPQDYPSDVWELTTERQNGRLVQVAPGAVAADGRGGWKLTRPIQLALR